MDVGKRDQIFICFSAKDRKTIAEPIAFHLKNYGFNVWYDRDNLLMGDNRICKNLIEGAKMSKYAIIVLSHNTHSSVCATEEIDIIKTEHDNNRTTIFPVLYEMMPNELSDDMRWITESVFKEVSKSTGTRQICNHIACKITDDYLKESYYKKIEDIILDINLPVILTTLLREYRLIDRHNLNSKVTLLYAVYSIIIQNNNHLKKPMIELCSSIYQRLFAETRLNLDVDYRELWLLENTICLLVNFCYQS